MNTPFPVVDTTIATSLDHPLAVIFLVLFACVIVVAALEPEE